MSRRHVLVWSAAVVAAVILVGGAVWLISTIVRDDEPVAVTPSSSEVPPAPSVFPTPTPGATEGVAPSAPPLEAEIGDVIAVTESVEVELIDLVRFEATDESPGELGGPALTVRVRVSNGTMAELDLAGATVNLTYGPEELAAAALGDPITEGLPASLAAGTSADGAYSFSLPLVPDLTLSVTLDLLVGEPIVVFRGPAPQQ